MNAQIPNHLGVKHRLFFILTGCSLTDRARLDAFRLRLYLLDLFSGQTQGISFCQCKQLAMAKPSMEIEMGRGELGGFGEENGLEVGDFLLN